VTLIVCPAASLAEVCRTRRPSHLLRMGSPGSDAPPAISVPHRLDLTFHDIVAPQAGLTSPEPSDVAAILDFAGGWDGQQPFAISCLAGISRSTAAAFIIVAARNPDLPEADLALALRQASPCATPNALIVALADDLLRRQGGMIAAIQAIGRGADYVPYISFDFALPPALA
jgi:predicted protein tyrosine phosphatase